MGHVNADFKSKVQTFALEKSISIHFRGVLYCNPVSTLQPSLQPHLAILSTTAQIRKQRSDGLTIIFLHEHSSNPIIVLVAYEILCIAQREGLCSATFAPPWKEGSEATFQLQPAY